MIELEKKFPSVEMLEKIAVALNVDTPELFSMQSFPAESLKQLHEAVLIDFEKVLSDRLADLRQSV
jgi:transcriptional regulator with XRE-family HTH domain